MTTKSRAGADELLPVLFRKWRPRPEHGEPGGDVEALFPTEPGDTHGKFVACFSMREGHVTADLRGVIDASVPATPSEYAPIKRALEKMGYKLKVYERTPPGAYQTLMAKLRAHRTGGGGAKSGPVSKCKSHGYSHDYARCPACGCEYCDRSWRRCPRCVRGTGATTEEMLALRTGGGGAVKDAYGRSMSAAARRVAEEEVAEMAEMLRRRKYADPERSAERLHAEGMGPFELEGRIKQSSPENERARRFPSLGYNFTFIRYLG